MEPFGRGRDMQRPYKTVIANVVCVFMEPMISNAYCVWNLCGNPKLAVLAHSVVRGQLQTSFELLWLSLQRHHEPLTLLHKAFHLWDPVRS